MNGFEKYSDLMVNQTNQILTKENFFNKPETVEVFGNHILGLSGPKHLVVKETKNGRNFSKLWYGFLEISDSYYCLIDIETYIGRFPYRDTEIFKTRHLGYHMENHLNEVYILKERLKSYFASLTRLYRKDNKHQEFLFAKQNLLGCIDDAFDGITITRGAHVHQKRFSDEDLKRLHTQEFLSRKGGKKLSIIGDLFKIGYGATRRKYKLTIKNNNKNIKKFLDMYFDILFQIITNKKGEFQYPKK